MTYGPWDGRPFARSGDDPTVRNVTPPTCTHEEPPMPRALRVLPILLVLAVASACSTAGTTDPDLATDSDDPVPTMPAATEPPAPEPGTALNACEIVTVADIASVVGIPEADIAEGTLEAEPTTLSPGHTECRYEGDWGGLIVDLTPEDGANLYDAARGSYGDASDREIAGADGGFWSEENSRGFFWKGSVTVMMQMGHVATGAEAGDVVTALGQLAMDKVD